MNLLQAFGYAAEREAWLGWILIAVAAFTVVVVSGLVLAASLRHRGEENRRIARGRRGTAWILIGGVIVPVAVLAGVLFLTFTTLTAVASPPSRPVLTIEVVGHTWWWEVRYPGESPGRTVVTANEIHVPVGETVRLVLGTADVIHSFWTPQLAGKMDLIPGQRNTLWLRADSAGTYRGQCGEYCGLQHAHMASLVVAQSPTEFARWLDIQRDPSLAPGQDEAILGRDVFVRSACALCHTIRGTEAGGRLGPDLTHLASRATLAAGTLRNTRGNLAGWIANPQELKPGTLMPAVPLAPAELRALLVYLETLR
jgi:cytochrome c oxidase subunit II